MGAILAVAIIYVIVVVSAAAHHSNENLTRRSANGNSIIPRNEVCGVPRAALSTNSVNGFHNIPLFDIDGFLGDDIFQQNEAHEYFLNNYIYPKEGISEETIEIFKTSRIKIIKVLCMASAYTESKVVDKFHFLSYDSPQQYMNYIRESIAHSEYFYRDALDEIFKILRDFVGKDSYYFAKKVPILSLTLTDLICNTMVEILSNDQDSVAVPSSSNRQANSIPMCRITERRNQFVVEPQRGRRHVDLDDGNNDKNDNDYNDYYVEQEDDPNHNDLTEQEQEDVDFLCSEIKRYENTQYHKLRQDLETKPPEEAKDIINHYYFVVNERIKILMRSYSPEVKEAVEARLPEIFDQKHPGRPDIERRPFPFAPASDAAVPAIQFVPFELQLELEAKIYDLDEIIKNEEQFHEIRAEVWINVMANLKGPQKYNCLDGEGVELRESDISVRGCSTGYSHHITNEKRNSKFSQIIETFNAANLTAGDAFLIDGFEFRNHEYEHLTQFLTDNDKSAHYVKFVNCVFEKKGLQVFNIQHIHDIQWLVFESCNLDPEFKDAIKAFAPPNAVIIIDSRGFQNALVPIRN